jgi:hypothetical protein
MPQLAEPMTPEESEAKAQQDAEECLETEEQMRADIHKLLPGSEEVATDVPTMCSHMYLPFLENGGYDF